ncbi:ComF family protein [Verrucomicrobiaceae bacterium N1E253]|uniref:ComF family protein n=1 Tax=Oceaniferula marina TaxID=2748318 RepID=A0A851GFF6_9BACT|nr:ComF family protein [Oceaniferula marina]NWK56146.1 ComF family protein [Oceaniferula marina]
MQRIVSRLFDFIYPATCHLCETGLSHGRHLCSGCAHALPVIEPPFCQQCGEMYDGQIDGPFTCPNCHKQDYHFSFARASLQSEGSARELIHAFKYQRQVHLAPDLAKLAQRALEDARFSNYPDSGIIVPVPLFWRRQQKRGFNQSEQIAIHLAKQTGIPTLNALKRTRNTATQTRFSRTKRLQNLKGAFSPRSRYLKELSNRRIILLDDVFTTGSTANECARTLSKHGASDIAILTVLRG